MSHSAMSIALRRAHDGRAAEVGRAIHVLPVVLDPQRVLADEIQAELLDHLLGRLQKTPGARLAEADDPGIGVDLHEQVAIDRQRLDASDLHSIS